MNRKGFTLVELIATLVILGIIVTIVVFSVGGNFGDSKYRSEEIFVNTIKDAMEVYLSSDAKDLEFVLSEDCELSKTNGIVSVYEASITFSEVINSKYRPISESDLVNPANKEVECNKNAIVKIYRDEDYVYYYSIDKNQFWCLLNISSTNIATLATGDFYRQSKLISNLPIVLDENGHEVYACS